MGRSIKNRSQQWIGWDAVLQPGPWLHTESESPVCLHPRHHVTASCLINTAGTGLEVQRQGMHDTHRVFVFFLSIISPQNFDFLFLSTPTHIHAHTRTLTHTRVRAHTCACTPTLIHTHTHARTHTRARAHTHTHTALQPRTPFGRTGHEWP